MHRAPVGRWSLRHRYLTGRRWGPGAGGQDARTAPDGWSAAAYTSRSALTIDSDSRNASGRWCACASASPWPTTCAELSELARRRGPASERAAERIDPIELVIDDPHGEHERITGRLRPPQRRHGRLREIEFGLGQLTR